MYNVLCVVTMNNSQCLIDCCDALFFLWWIPLCATVQKPEISTRKYLDQN